MNAPTIPTAGELAWHFVGDRLRDEHVLGLTPEEIEQWNEGAA